MVSWVYTEKSTLLDKRQKLNGKLNILSSFGNNEKNTIGIETSGLNLTNQASCISYVQ